MVREVMSMKMYYGYKENQSTKPSSGSTIRDSRLSIIHSRLSNMQRLYRVWYFGYPCDLYEQPMRADDPTGITTCVF